MYAIETENMGAAFDFALSCDFLITDPACLQGFLKSGLHLRVIKTEVLSWGEVVTKINENQMKMIIFITTIDWFY